MNSAPVSHTMRPMSLPMPGHVPTPMPAPPSTSHDLHTRQTIDRLQCIQKHLKDPSMFRRTARELLEWCSDTRAFQPQFHQCLMNCLTVINDVAGKPGFDLDLCYRLFHLCNEHRGKFQPSAAALLSVWFNNVQKLAQMHQQHTHMDAMKPNNMPHQAGPSPINPSMMNSKMGYPQAHTAQRIHDQSSWSQPAQNAPPLPNQHPSLSVITTATVWGVSATQTPPVPVHSQSPSTSFSQQHMRHPGSHMGSENIHSNYNNNYAGGHNKGSMGDSFQPSSAYPGPQRGLPNTRMGAQSHHINSDQPHHPPAAAAAAAAVAAAAAAATATATATATFIKEHQDQNQLNAYEQIPPGGPMSHSMPPDTLNHRPMSSHPQHYPPISNTQMHPQMNRLRSQGPPQYGRAASVPSSFPVNSLASPQPLSHNVPPMYNNGSSFKSSCRPQQPYNQIQYNGCPPGGASFNKSSDGNSHVGLHRQMSGMQPTSGYSPRLPSSAPPQMQPSHNQFYPHQSQGNPSDPFMSSHAQRPTIPPHYPNETRFSNSQPPIPGNPTPPLTPGSAHNVPPYPGVSGMGMGDGKNGGMMGEPFFPPFAAGNGVAPSQSSGSDELRLTFPVRDGIVLGPFRLEHNLVLSSHAFHLRQHVYKTLCERADLDLQFKCYHHDDLIKHTNWPHSVQVSVNSTPLTIPRGVDRSTHKPLYLKRVCHPGRNAIDITVSACCCSHFFVLQLVHRPSIRFVLKGLMVKRILPEINCRTKIKRNFSNGVVVTNNSTMTNGVSGFDQNATSVKVSLMCPITLRRLQIPARGHDCKHIQCFDLESYLQSNSENASWRCPICHKNALLEVLEVDDFMQNILKSVQDPDYKFVSIDANCNWAPLPGGPHHEPISRTSTGPMDHMGMLPNGLVKQEQFNNFPETGKPQAGSVNSFGVKQEQFISALSIKQEPHQHHHINRPIKQDPDGPPNKRLKSVTSPGVSLNNLPAPSPGSSGACNKIGDPGFPHSYDLHQRFGSTTSSGSMVAGYLRGSPAVSMTTEISDIAANDMVPIEKRLNPAMSRTHSGSPGRKSGCAGTPRTPQGPGTPLRPPSSSSAVLTPQSIGCTSNNCSTPSFVPNSYNVNSSMAPQATCTNNSGEQAPASINPATPVVSMPNCPDLDPDGFGMLDSLFEDSVGRVGESVPTSLPYDPGAALKTADEGSKDDIPSLEEILPETNDLMDVLPLAEMPTTTENTNNTEEEILSLFADP